MAIPLFKISKVTLGLFYYWLFAVSVFVKDYIKHGLCFIIGYTLKLLQGWRFALSLN
jgi:hypothetical protein